jgi:hypothetical protein
MDEILKLQPTIGLSQVFQVAENCYKEDSQNYKVLVTSAPCDKSLLTTIAKKVIVIGEEDNCDINTKELTKKTLSKHLEQEFQKLI